LWEGPTSNDDGGNTPVLERGNTPVLIQMFPQVLFWTVKRVHAIIEEICLFCEKSHNKQITFLSLDDKPI